MNVNDHLRFKMQNKSFVIWSQTFGNGLLFLYPRLNHHYFLCLTSMPRIIFYHLIVHKRYVKLLILSQTNAFDKQAFIKRF